MVSFSLDLLIKRSILVEVGSSIHISYSLSIEGTHCGPYSIKGDVDQVV